MFFTSQITILFAGDAFETLLDEALDKAGEGVALTGGQWGVTRSTQPRSKDAHGHLNVRAFLKSLAAMFSQEMLVKVRNYPVLSKHQENRISTPDISTELSQFFAAHEVKC